MLDESTTNTKAIFYRPTKIGVCTAWGSPFTWTDPAYNLMNWQRPEGVEVKFFPGRGRDPGARHSWGVESALRWGASHIMFFGADQIADEDILIKMVKHLEDGWPMVTGITPARGFIDLEGNGKAVPFPMAAWKWKEGEARRMSIKALEPVKREDGDVQECAIVGSGAVIFAATVIRALQRPWFKELPADDDGFRPPMMDTTWCYRMVTEGGAKMVCDWSIRITHLDVFPIDNTFQRRFADLHFSPDAKDYFLPKTAGGQHDGGKP